MSSQASEIESKGVFEVLFKQKGLSVETALLFAMAVLTLAIWVYQMYSAFFGPVRDHYFRLANVAFFLEFFWLLQAYKKKVRAGTGRIGIGFYVDLLLLAATIFFHIFMQTFLPGIEVRNSVLSLTTLDNVIAALAIILVLEATRRSIGWTVVIVILLFIGEALFADRLPGILHGHSTSLVRVLSTMSLAPSGIFGTAIEAVSSFVILFMFYGSFLLQTGAGRLFTDLAVSLFGRARGGPAKGAVVASAMMGTISGSAMANVVTVGTFTIPMMKQIGYKPVVAAAIETCASTGGMIMPPVMGTAAFLMSYFLGIPYFKIVIASTVPALIYFFCVYWMVHFEAEKHAMRAYTSLEVPKASESMKKRGHLLLPIIAIVYLLFMGYTPTLAAFWSIILTMALSFLRKETRLSPQGFLAGLSHGVNASVSVVVVCAAVGIIIDSNNLSGLGLRFSSFLLGFSGGLLPVALILAMIISIILGMGLTATAVYITVVATIVPSLVNLGVDVLAGHMFAFYYGVVGGITPPVAIVAFTAAAVAGAPPMSTAVTASKMGIAIFILPFLWIYSPQILLLGYSFSFELVLTIFSAFAGTFALVAGVQGWLLKSVSIPERFILLISALLLYLPDFRGYLVGFLLLGAVVVFQAYSVRKKKARLAA